MTFVIQTTSFGSFHAFLNSNTSILSFGHGLRFKRIGYLLFSVIFNTCSCQTDHSFVSIRNAKISKTFIWRLVLNIQSYLIFILQARDQIMSPVRAGMLTAQSSRQNIFQSAKYFLVTPIILQN